MQSPSYRLRFAYPLEYPKITITLEALAEPSECRNYFRVHSFSRNGNPVPLEPIRIRRKKVSEKNTWIHTDSEMATLLSTSAGGAIDESVVSCEL